MNKLEFVTLKGPDIQQVFSDLAQLRIRVFRDFPYLYEGSEEYELSYLEVYSRSADSLLFAIYSEGRMIGASTCIPLCDETGDVQEPFLNAGIDPATLFYFGESILLPEFRGQGLGHRFFDEREAHARSFGTYRETCFCSVVRADEHPQKPADYRTNDAFWTGRGYIRQPEIRCIMSWPDLHEEHTTEKELVFWTRPL